MSAYKFIYSTKLLYLQFGKRQLMRFHLDRWWSGYAVRQQWLCRAAAVDMPRGSSGLCLVFGVMNCTVVEVKQ